MSAVTRAPSNATDAGSANVAATTTMPPPPTVRVCTPIHPIRSPRFLVELLSGAGDRVDGLPEPVGLCTEQPCALALAAARTVFDADVDGRPTSGSKSGASLAEMARRFCGHDQHGARPDRVWRVHAALRALAVTLKGRVAVVVVTLEGRDSTIGSVVGALTPEDAARAAHQPLRGMRAHEARDALASQPALVFLVDPVQTRSVTLLRVGEEATPQQLRQTLSDASAAAIARLRARLDASGAALEAALADAQGVSSPFQ